MTCSRGGLGKQGPTASFADVAQLVEHLLAKQEVVGSNPIIRFCPKQALEKSLQAR